MSDLQKIGVRGRKLLAGGGGVEGSEAERTSRIELGTCLAEITAMVMKIYLSYGG